MTVYPPGDDRDEDSGRSGRIPESIRKALLSGLSAVVMTEEGIRSALSDLRLPKDALAYLAQQTDRTRRDLFGAVSDEIKGFLKGIDLTGELRKALTGLKVQVRAEVTFVDESTTKTKIEADFVEAKEGEKGEAPARKTRSRRAKRKT